MGRKNLKENKMDKERLQAYKMAIGIGIKAGCGFEVAPIDMQELMDIITTLEATQAELAEAENAAGLWMESSNIFREEYTRVVKEAARPANEFEKYWKQYGELHASMCNGNIKQFAKEIWQSALGNLDGKRFSRRSRMYKERLQELKYDVRRGRMYDVPNDWDCNYESLYDVIEELITAYEKDQQQLAEARVEVKRLEDLYSTDRCNYLDDITLLQTEVGRLRTALEEYADKNYWLDKAFEGDENG